VGNCTVDDPLSQCASSSTLQITDATAIDSGEYTCAATNKVEKAAKLVIKDKIQCICNEYSNQLRLQYTLHVHLQTQEIKYMHFCTIITRQE